MNFKTKCLIFFCQIVNGLYYQFLQLLSKRGQGTLSIIFGIVTNVSFTFLWCANGKSQSSLDRTNHRNNIFAIFSNQILFHFFLKNEKVKITNTDDQRIILKILKLNDCKHQGSPHSFLWFQEAPRKPPWDSKLLVRSPHGFLIPMYVFSRKLPLGS